MTGMSCANLLAFIQIAVVFDFGLLYLKDGHIFSDILKSFRRELSAGTETLVAQCDKALKRLEVMHPNITIRIKKETVKSAKERLAAMVNPDDNFPWAKYAYLGLYSGVYGLLCLLVIGVFGCEYDGTLQDFLLISAQTILLLEILSLIQLSKRKSHQASMLKVIRKTWELAVILSVIMMMAFLGWVVRIYSNFETPFLLSTIVIVYLPFIVFFARIVYAKIQINKAKKECQDALANCLTEIQAK